ncbi:MAG TPA: hypothetical protein RMH99_18530 [Sandaracinaceae bacterium LLY-WYZ-13_1]|nr:hypothetical protein [Sandaracinaceae bacterium LLY-WYZ-13_1]
MSAPERTWDGTAEGLPEEGALDGVLLRAEAPPTSEGIAALAARGATGARLLVPWQGARREVHDFHAGEGAFDATVRALTAARSHGIETWVHTVITRSNARVLGELPARLKARGVRGWIVAWPRVAADDAPAWTARVPRLGLAAPAALAALERARRLGLSAWLHDLPLCVAGPYASRVTTTGARSYGARCESCAARHRCAGVDAAYLRRFGEGELRPLKAG